MVGQKSIEPPMKWNWGLQKLEPDLEQLRKDHPRIKVRPLKISGMPKKWVIWFLIIIILVLILGRIAIP